ncbi:hypothetical protein [Streptomyces sp. NBC_01537]|uniref:hypothetical protein n=1 Tax=Streptomyces sp. NBC_01537 TaxID=2903896 RepID=UPI00386376E7
MLEAAAAVFDEYGYDCAAISQILARAEVTKGASSPPGETVYHRTVHSDPDRVAQHEVSPVR